jgi:magnesium transporter
MTAPVAPLPVPSEHPMPGSIDDHLVTAVPLCEPGTPAAELRAGLAGDRYEFAADVAVCTVDGPGHRLLGLIPIERVLAAQPGALARDLMDPDPPVIAPGLDQEAAAWRAAEHGESSLAVVDDRGVFRGLVPPERLLPVLAGAHERDLARLGGFLRSAASARRAIDEPLATRLWHRLPWLLLGLLGSAGAAVMVQGFEVDLASDVRLAFFIPGIVYMADAVGTQTEALMIRGLSVGVEIRRVFRLEAVTGLSVGLVVALLAYPGVWLMVGSQPIALVVSIALVAACSVATAVAMSLPWLVSWLGRDPAFGSGPLATVVQDLLSLVIYFAVAATVLG